MSKARSHEGQEAPGWSLDFYFKYNGSHWKALAYLVAQMVKKKKKNLPAMLETWVPSLGCVGKIAWRSEWLPTTVFLSGEFHRGAWWATVYWVARRQTRLSD